MKSCKFSIVFLLLAAASAQGLVRTWDDFKQVFNKVYRDRVEEDFRRRLWETNHRRAIQHNSNAARGLQNFTMDDNHLSDLTEAEVKQMLGTVVPETVVPIVAEGSEPIVGEIIPSTLNLTTSPCMPAVKNQGSCGSCWAFTANTPVEFLTCNRTSPPKPTTLSESQLVNCSSAQGNKGCTGGWYPNAWKYVQIAPGQASSSVLPYYPLAGTCLYDAANMQVTTVVSYGQLPAYDTEQIMQNLNSRGPLAAAMMVLTDTFSYYRSGVYSDPLCPSTCAVTDVNHAVVLVGYGIETGSTLPYWLVRNSWGTKWGDRGYFKILRGVNMCNIECYVYHVTV